MVEIDSIQFAKRLQRLFREPDPIPIARELKFGKRKGKSNREMARMAGCGETHVRDMLLLLNLAPVTQLKFQGGASYRR